MIALNTQRLHSEAINRCRSTMHCTFYFFYCNEINSDISAI